MQSLGTPLVLPHQPSYSMLNRWIEDGLLDVLGEEGVGCIAFLASWLEGLLTGLYFGGVPADSRAAQGRFLSASRDWTTRPWRTCTRSTGSPGTAVRRSPRWL